MEDLLPYIRQQLCSVYPDSELRSLTQILIEEVTGMKVHLFVGDKSNHLTQNQKKWLNEILERLRRCEPFQYIVGKSEFCGMSFQVNRDVLIPRPETEELVEWIVREYQSQKVSILDIGTGSGCIAVSLAKFLPQATVEAWDVSLGALAVAKKNAQMNGVTVNFRQMDVLCAKPETGNRFDVIVSNPPYVMESEKLQMEKNVLDYEPSLALFVGDEDPLLFYRKIAELGKSILKPAGNLFFEINAQKGNEIVELLADFGYKNVELKRDISSNNRMTKGTL